MSGVALLGACETTPYEERTASVESVAQEIKNCPEPPCVDPEPEPDPSDPTPQPQLSAAKGSGGINVAWTNVPSNVKRTLYRQLSISWDCSQIAAGARVAVATIAAGSTQATAFDTTIADLNSPSRHYYILAYGTKEISVTLELGKHPGIDFEASVDPFWYPDSTTERRVQFEWRDNVITEKEFVVERRIGLPSSTNYKEVFKISGQYNATCRKYVGYEYGVKAGEAYCYRLKAVGNNGVATYSELSCPAIAEPGCPDNPGGGTRLFSYCKTQWEPFEMRAVQQAACTSGQGVLLLWDQFPDDSISVNPCP